MSVRSVGNQLLQTAPSSLLGGASNVSASFWVRANPGNNVAATGGVEIFGDSGKKFSAKLSGTGGLQLQWSSNDGHLNAVSTCTLALIPGTAYHVATTWQVGSQQYYLNGVEVEVDTQVGSLGVVGDTSSHPFRLGSDQAGTDVTLDQPTLWVGYTLTAQDVANLRNRSVQPGGIAPSSIALAWSLAGADGVAVKVGDAGLADASVNGLALSSIVGSAPTYQAGDLAYVATPTIGKLAASPSGKSILLLAQDGTGVNANITNLASSSEVQSIALTAAPAGNAFPLSFEGHTTASIPITVAPPLSYATWSFPVVSGHSYTLAAESLPTIGIAYILFETIEAGVTVASTKWYYNVTRPGTPITDSGVLNGSGDTVIWYPINNGLTASGSTMQVRITGANDGNFFSVYSIRVQDTTASTIAYYSLGTTPSDVVVAGYNYPPGTNQEVYGSTIQSVHGGGGEIVTVTGGASALQSALQALSSIGSGGVTVADDSGQGNGNYEITFVGPNANASWPLITCTDPAVAIAEVNHGGNFPTLSINGGSPILLANWLWTTAGDNPAALSILPQSAPQVQTFTPGGSNYANSPQYTWGSGIKMAGSLSGQPFYGPVPGGMFTMSFPNLPSGTYQVAITYPTAPFSYSTTNYTPATNSVFVVKDAAGNTLGSYTINQSIAPADYTDADGRAWKILGSYTTNLVQNGLSVSCTSSAPSSGNPIPVPVLDAVQLVRTSADASVVIGPDDSATLSIPANWMTTASGAFPATANLAITPPSKYTILPPFVAGRKSMKAGYNVEPSTYYEKFLSHSNIATILELGTGAIATDANGYPTKIPKPPYHGQGFASAILIQSIANPQWNDPLQGTAVLPSGRYIMRWDGSTTDLALQPFYGTTITPVPSLTTITGTTANQAVYDIEADPVLVAGASFQLNISSDVVDETDATGNTYLCDVTNLEIYPPDPSDPTGQTVWGLNTTTGTFKRPQKFHPWFLNMLRGVQCLRFLDPLNTNDNPYFSFDQIKAVTHANRSGRQYTGTIPITSVSAPDPALVAPGYSSYSMAIQVTTSIPHNVYNGCQCFKTSNVGSIVAADGGSINIDQNIDPAFNPASCQVIDATNLIIYMRGPRPAVMGATVTPAGASIQVGYGTSWPLQDVVDLVAAVRCTDLHFNVSLAADTSVGGCVDQIAAFLADKLPTGVKVHIELGNECWNTLTIAGLYGPVRDAFLTGQFAFGNYQNFYTQQAKAVHERFQAIFSSAGRPTDVVYLWGGWQTRGDIVGGLLQHAQTIGARVDEVCVALYYSNQNMKHGLESTQQPIYQALDTDQVMDFFEFNSVYGEQDYGQRQVSAVFPTSGYPSAKLMAYEGSCDNSVPDINGPNGPNYAIRRNAARRHPRMYGVMLNQAQVYQDAGMTLWNVFQLASQTQEAEWDTYEYADQQLGTGDPSKDTANATNPQAKNLVKSEVGGAWSYWATLVQPVSSIKKNPYILGRNGRGKAIGVSRGLFRSAR